jgi:hypothetical protein
MLAIVLMLAGASAGGHGLLLLGRGWRLADDEAGPLWIARGLQGSVVSVGALSLAGAGRVAV